MKDLPFLNTKSASRKATKELLIWSYVRLFTYLENEPSSSLVLSTIPRHHGETGSFYATLLLRRGLLSTISKEHFFHMDTWRSSEFVIRTYKFGLKRYTSTFYGKSSTKVIEIQ